MLGSPLYHSLKSSARSTAWPAPRRTTPSAARAAASASEREPLEAAVVVARDDRHRNGRPSHADPEVREDAVPVPVQPQELQPAEVVELRQLGEDFLKLC
jgi:hypothetical protein